MPPHWRFDPEGTGTRLVLVLPYAVEPAWLRIATHEVTAWVLHRRAARRVSFVVDRIAERSASPVPQPTANPAGRGRPSDAGPSAPDDRGTG